MAFAQNKDMIEEFTPDTAHETLANGVRLGRIGWCVDERDPGAIHRMFKQSAVFAIIIANQEPRTFSKRRRLSDRICWATQASLGERVTLTCTTRLEPCSMMKKRKITRKNRS